MVAYAVYRGGRVLFRNALFRAYFDGEAHMCDALLETKTIYHFQTPIAHYAMRYQFSLGGEDYTLLICLPDETVAGREQEIDTLMQSAGDLFRVILAFTEAKNAPPSPVEVHMLVQDICVAVKQQFSAALAIQAQEGTVSRGTAVLLNREGFLLTLGFLLPCLLERGRVTVTLEKDANDALVIAFCAERTVNNSFHRALAREIGAACGFCVYFEETGLRFVMAACHSMPHVLHSADVTADVACLQIGSLLCADAEVALA
ncbi:MAG: hypothetical protein IJY20_03670 [Clostridia bacterium]|nr:hypothetical protein [Clostridia bacterium]